MSSKKALVASVAGCAALVLAGCGGDADGGDSAAQDDNISLRVLTWTSNPDQLAIFDDIANEFIADNPNVTQIEFESVAAADLPTVLTTQLLGGDPPDVSWLAIEDSRYFIDAGVLLDLQPTLEDTEGYEPDDLIDDLLVDWRRDSATYGVPMSNSGRALFYNADLFAEAGVDNPEEMIAAGTYTWDNFADAVRAVSDTTGEPGFIIDGAKWSGIVPVLYAYGARPWNEEATQCTLTEPEGIEAMSLIHRMIFEDESVPLPSTTQNFWGGQGGATNAYISSASLLADADFGWGAVPSPSGPAGDLQQIGQTAWVAYDSGDHAEVAGEFIAFLTNKENAATLSKFFAPPRESLLTAETLHEASPVLSVEQLTPLVEAARTGRTAPIPNNAATTNLALDAALDEYFYQPGIDVPEALASICGELESALSAE